MFERMDFDLTVADVGEVAVPESYPQSPRRIGCDTACRGQVRDVLPHDAPLDPHQDSWWSGSRNPDALMVVLGDPGHIAHWTSVCPSDALESSVLIHPKPLVETDPEATGVIFKQ